MGKIEKKGSWFELSEFGHEGKIDGVTKGSLAELAEKIVEHLSNEQLINLSFVVDSEIAVREGDIMEDYFQKGKE